MGAWDTTIGVGQKINVNKIQVFQNIILRKITNAPYFVSNLSLYNDLNIKSIEYTPAFFYKRVFLNGLHKSQ